MRWYVGLLCLLLVVQEAAAYKVGCGQVCNDKDLTCGDDQCSKCLRANVNATSGYCVRGHAENEHCVVDRDCYQVGDYTKCDKSKCVKADKSKSYALGFICCVIAVVMFGSNFIPVKQFETGDGVFFQWILCCAIWFVGLGVNFARGCPPFHAWAALGGILWATGNMCVVPVLKCIGMGLGIAIWGAANMSMGWLSGTLGILGVEKEETNKQGLNVVGFIIVLVGTTVFASIQPASADDDKENAEHSINTTLLVKENPPWESRLTATQKRIVGVGLSILSGILYGSNFNPPQHLIDSFDTLTARHTSTYTDNGLDYVFSHFTGIWMASTTYFAIYCVVKRNKPDIYPKVILPALASGVMWAAAETSWFIANTNLSLVIAFPIICGCPTAVSLAWGVLVFGEIKGRKNFILLAVAFTITIVGVVLITLSKV